MGEAGPPSLGRPSKPVPCAHLLSQPDTLGALPNLRELWLDRNQLSALPPVSGGVGAPAQRPAIP